MTTTRRHFLTQLVLVIAAVWMAPGFLRADTKEQLRDRFAACAKDIRAYKTSGKLGETTTGVIESVNPADASADAKLKNLIAEENADRQELYAMIAKDQGADVSVVATRAAKRNYEKALPGDWLKTAAGQWLKK